MPELPLVHGTISGDRSFLFSFSEKRHDATSDVNFKQPVRFHKHFTCGYCFLKCTRKVAVMQYKKTIKPKSAPRALTEIPHQMNSLGGWETQLL